MGTNPRREGGGHNRIAGAKMMNVFLIAGAAVLAVIVVVVLFFVAGAGLTALTYVKSL